MDELHTLLQPGSTVYTILRHVSKSGMMRRVDTVIVVDGRIRRINHLVAKAIGYRRNLNDGSIVVTGCGMDAGFEVVYALGCAMWPKGTPEPHGKRNGEPDSEGGYALKQEWL